MFRGPINRVVVHSVTIFGLLSVPGVCSCVLSRSNFNVLKV